MLLTVLIVLTVYLAACYGYGIYLLIKRGTTSASNRTQSDPRSVVIHRYPSAVSNKAAA